MHAANKNPIASITNPIVPGSGTVGALNSYACACQKLRASVHSAKGSSADS